MMPMPQLPAITLASLLHFSGAIAWCVLLLLSAAGYGTALLRVCRLRRPPLALASATGIGVLIALGGLLNLLGVITRPVLFVVAAAGWVAAGVLLARRSARRESGVHESYRRTSTLTRILLGGFLVFFLGRLGASVHTVYYQPSDDYNFYLAEPVKMLATHSFAADPFSERRIMSSLGGNHFLEVLTLAALDLEDVQMADRALGLMLTALLAFAIARQFGLSRTQGAALALFLLATPQLQFNLTFVILPSALFFALAYVSGMGEDLLEGRPGLQGLLLGVLAGAVGTLKSTYVVHAVVFVACVTVLFALARDLRSAAKTAIFATVGCLALMLPWMIANRAASGTLFYPTLGLGFHYSAYHFYPSPGGAHFASVLKKVLPFNAPLLLVLAAEWIWGERDEPSRSAMALVAAAAIASVLVGIATGGDSVRRYNYPCILPAVLLAFPVFCRRSNAEPHVPLFKLLQFGAAALSAGAALYVGFNSFTWEYAWALRCLRTGVHDLRIVSPKVAAEYAALGRALPADSATLATVNDSFLLPFGSRHIYLADVPGAASLPPGWPAKQPGDALARFLLAHGIRYLAYSYGDSASMTDAAEIKQMNDERNTVWIRTEARSAFNAHQQYRELAASRRHLFDDGNIYVLDLATPVAP